jgi:hypothetical protein
VDVASGSSASVTSRVAASNSPARSKKMLLFSAEGADFHALNWIAQKETFFL